MKQEYGCLLLSKCMKEEMDKIADYLLLRSGYLQELGLFHGKMGVVVALYLYADAYGDEVMREYAWELFQQVYDGVHTDMPVGLERGLAGIGYGTTFLCKRGLVECSLNDILEDIDRKIMERDPRRLTDMSVRSGLRGLMLYLGLRQSVEAVTTFDSRYMMELQDTVERNNLSCRTLDFMDVLNEPTFPEAEYHPAAHAAFKIAGRAAHVERDHALVLVPDIHHPVDLLVAGLGVVVGEQGVPVPVQRVHCCVKLCRGTVFSDHRVCARLVDHAGRGEFLILRVFHIAETKEKLPRLAGPQRHMELHRADRRPAVGDRIGAAAVLDRFGQRRRAVEADKGVARGIEAVIRAVRPEHGIVIPPLAVFGFVINGVRLQLDLADGEVPLEVGAVVHRVPEAELYIGEHIERLFRGSPIFQRQPDEQAVVALRDQQRLCGRNTIFLPLNHAVAEAVAAGIAVQLRFRGLPAGVPDGIAVFDVNMEALLIDRAVIVAVAGQPAQPRVAIEAVAARRIRQECEKILAPEVIDPRQRRARACDHILAPLIVKETKLHLRTPPSPEDPCVPAESKSIKCLI